MPNALYNFARVTTSTEGPGPVILDGGAGWLSFAESGAPDGAVVTYAFKDQNGGFETGQGTYSELGPTLSRDLVYRSSGAGNNTRINLSGVAEVFITAAAEDFEAFWGILETAAATDMGRLSDQVFLPNLDFGLLTGCGDTPTRGFTSMDLGTF